jgi:hypothetical protein
MAEAFIVFSATVFCLLGLRGLLNYWFAREMRDGPLSQFGKNPDRDW